MGGEFDAFITQHGSVLDIYAPDVTTLRARGQRALFENARTIDMLGRAQADLFHLYFPSTCPCIIDVGDVPKARTSGVYYLIVKPLTLPGELGAFMSVGQMSSALQMPTLATLKQLVSPLPDDERNGMDEPLHPDAITEMHARSIPVALENDFEPLLLSGTQMTTLPEGVMTLYVPKGINVSTQDVIVLDDGTAIRVQQANRYPAQGKIVARQVIGWVMDADPYGAA